MQQRRLRLGDILDDYCPRERRITNHAVVAMIDDTVKQTRCTTCDADHEYRHARLPAARRRKDASPVAQLVDGAHPDFAAEEQVEEHEASTAEPPAAEDHVETLDAADAPMESGGAADEPIEPSDEDREQDEWPVHRPLIRATLPRPEGQMPERKAPDFTFRPQGGKFDAPRNQRPRGHRPARHAQSQHGSGSRFGGPRPQGGQGSRGTGQGGPPGQRHGNRQDSGGGSRPGRGRGRKRGR